MATLEQVERQIFEREGFRVTLEPFAKNARYAPYAYPVMASNAWRVSEWKTQRLAPYLVQIRSARVFRGDGSPLRTDLKLGSLRDSYFDAYERERDATGVAAAPPAPPPDAASDNVVPIRPSRRRGS